MMLYLHLIMKMKILKFYKIYLLKLFYKMKFFGIIDNGTPVAVTG